MNKQGRDALWLVGSVLLLTLNLFVLHRSVKRKLEDPAACALSKAISSGHAGSKIHDSGDFKVKLRADPQRLCT